MRGPIAALASGFSKWISIKDLNNDARHAGRCRFRRIRARAASDGPAYGTDHSRRHRTVRRPVQRVDPVRRHVADPRPRPWRRPHQGAPRGASGTGRRGDRVRGDGPRAPCHHRARNDHHHEVAERHAVGGPARAWTQGRVLDCRDHVEDHRLPADRSLRHRLCRAQRTSRPRHAAGRHPDDFQRGHGHRLCDRRRDLRVLSSLPPLPACGERWRAVRRAGEGKIRVAPHPEPSLREASDLSP